MRPLWCKGTSRSVSGLLRPRGAGDKAPPLVVRTGRGMLRDQDLRGREVLTPSPLAALMKGWTLGLWPGRERRGTEPNHAARCPSPNPRPSLVRKQAIRDAPARSEEARPSERDPPPPLTLEEAVDTWLLVLGIRGIDEGTQDFLPERVVGAIQETFMGFEGVDRLTMALAFTRVVQNLLSSVGRLLEQAVTLPVPSARDPNAAEEVEVEVDEEDDDSSLYMQLGMREPWTQVLRKLQVALEGQPKGTRECNIRRLLSWLDHRVTRTASFSATSKETLRICLLFWWPTGMLSWKFPLTRTFAQDGAWNGSCFWSVTCPCIQGPGGPWGFRCFGILPLCSSASPCLTPRTRNWSVLPNCYRDPGLGGRRRV